MIMKDMENSALLRLMSRDRLVITGGIVSITVISWAYMLWMASDAGMSVTGAMAPGAAGWSFSYGLTILVMWIVMMIAMMAPSASPMVLTYARLGRERDSLTNPAGHSGLLALGYLAAWSGLSVAATIAQWGFSSAGALSPMMATTNTYAGGAILILAGLFQWSPLKLACLKHCRSPIGFFMTEWRDGPGGAFSMGLRHGLYCVGCCWALMTVLFVTGVMNLLWVAVIAVFVLLERAVAKGRTLSRVTGAMLAAAGVWMIAG